MMIVCGGDGESVCFCVGYEERRSEVMVMVCKVL